MECFECGAEVTVSDPAEPGDALLRHAREEHEWPYPDQAIRNYAEATLRLTGPSERLAEIGRITIHPVTEDRLGDWLGFFDRDAFVGKPEWAACYCLEPHRFDPENPPQGDVPHWSENREGMAARLRSGGAFGYLAYVADRPAGWVNASLRADYSLYRLVNPDGPAPDSVIGVSCFIIAPPYRRHGIAGALLDRVMADAADRGAAWVEGYPTRDPEDDDAGHFRGPRRMFETRGFIPVEEQERYTVMRRAV